MQREISRVLEQSRRYFGLTHSRYNALEEHRDEPDFDADSPDLAFQAQMAARLQQTSAQGEVRR